jgi:hypothetical protein
VGAFYGSIHVRSANVAEVRRALEEVAARRALRFLIAPPSHGWISVYPSGRGQNLSVSADIAASLGVPILHLLLHDDGVFAYALHGAGGPIDKYCSDPDYFGAVEPEQRDGSAGRPGVLATLAENVDIEQIATALERRRGAEPFRARSQLVRVAQLLRIRNVETSYDDLRAGETDGITGWKAFVHVPDLTTEKEAAKRRRAEIAAATRRLQRDGVLLASEKPAQTSLWAMPLFCAHPQGGFLKAWRTSAMPYDADLRWWQPTGESDVGVRIRSTASRIGLSSSGRFLAVGNGAEGWGTVLVDMHDGRTLMTVPLSQSTAYVSFTTDERLMLCRSERDLYFVNMTDAYAVESLRIGHGTNAVLHPNGDRLIADVSTPGGTAALAIIDLSSRTVVSTLRTAVKDLGAWMQAYASGKAVTGFHPQEMPTSLAFSPDGHLLALAVHEGLRVYQWADVLRARESLPEPLFSASSQLVRVNDSWHQHTYGVAMDASRGTVYFSSLEGCVRALNLASGRTTAVFEAPGAPPLVEIDISSDGACLAVVARPGLFSRARQPPAPLWQVWNVGATTGHE